jgi:hypothetical protein
VVFQRRFNRRIEAHAAPRGSAGLRHACPPGVPAHPVARRWCKIIHIVHSSIQLARYHRQALALTPPYSNVALPAAQLEYLLNGWHELVVSSIECRRHGSTEHLLCFTSTPANLPANRVETANNAQRRIHEVCRAPRRSIHASSATHRKANVNAVNPLNATPIVRRINGWFNSAKP